MPHMIETLEEFEERHGEKFWVEQAFFYEDGAVRDSYDRRYEPPTDPKQLLVLKHRFAEAKLANWVRRYRQHKDYLRHQASWYQMGVGPAPTQEEVDILPEWAEKIAELEEQRDQLKAQLPDHRRHEEEDRMQQEHRQQATKLLQSINDCPNY